MKEGLCWGSASWALRWCGGKRGNLNGEGTTAAAPWAPVSAAASAAADADEVTAAAVAAAVAAEGAAETETKRPA